MLKFRAYRAGVVLSTIATLAVAAGAGHKF